ncbi:uncharacterized protein Dsimw501_GD28806 [Drosophila simulans]|uniref:Uncharacterized protein n=1 Tax=Drosophila simulans TaxID=7240 RepID=A0A0J9RT02_DROSI|nr:uncharacterized protein Dsimw501_GD28806 [Drosophila simulans]
MNNFFAELVLVLYHRCGNSMAGPQLKHLKRDIVARQPVSVWPDRIDGSAFSTKIRIITKCQLFEINALQQPPQQQQQQNKGNWKCSLTGNAPAYRDYNPFIGR